MAPGLGDQAAAATELTGAAARPRLRRAEP